MEFSVSFKGEIFYWRGPSPFHFVEISSRASAKIREHRKELTYGWGVIPVNVNVESFEWSTALFPKDEIYLLPVKDLVRKSLSLEVGDVLTGKMTFSIKQ